MSNNPLNWTDPTGLIAPAVAAELCAANPVCAAAVANAARQTVLMCLKAGATAAAALGGLWAAHNASGNEDDDSYQGKHPDNQSNVEEAADSISKAQAKLRKRDKGRGWDKADDEWGTEDDEWGDKARPKGCPIDCNDKTTKKNWKNYY